MYQSPDFIKVELDVKDNFASYSSCYRKTASFISIPSEYSAIKSAIKL